MIKVLLFMIYIGVSYLLANKIWGKEEDKTLEKVFLAIVGMLMLFGAFCIVYGFYNMLLLF